LTRIPQALLTPARYSGSALDHFKNNKGRSMKHCTCNPLPDAGRRSFFASAATAVAAVGVVATSAMAAEPARAQPAPQGGQRRFMEEAARLAIESVEKGWGGPFGAVITRNGEIIGRGQNRVLLTGCPVYHAEVTAIVDASAHLNPKALLGSEYAKAPFWK
jgi:hypothetical protein